MGGPQSGIGHSPITMRTLQDFLILSLLLHLASSVPLLNLPNSVQDLPVNGESFPASLDGLLIRSHGDILPISLQGLPINEESLPDSLNGLPMSRERHLVKRSPRRYYRPRNYRPRYQGRGRSNRGQGGILGRGLVTDVVVLGGTALGAGLIGAGLQQALSG